MKIAALTMVYQDYWAISKWYIHHGRELGFSNLFIISHGENEKLKVICPQANIIIIPRSGLEFFDKKRAKILNTVQSGLNLSYDWVLQTDADELICYDQNIYKNLVQAITHNPNVPVLTALGFDVVEVIPDLELSQKSIFFDRRNIAFSGHYSKAIASQIEVNFSLHGVCVERSILRSFPYFIPKGLYLAHLKFANIAALEKLTVARMQVANSYERGLPGYGWKHADEDASKFFRNFMKKKLVPWKEAENIAYSTLSPEPLRKPRFNLVKTKSLQFPVRTLIPKFFACQG
jgi:hypothetical protein